MRVAICEDTPMEADFLLEMLDMYQATVPHIRIEVEHFESAEALVEALSIGRDYQLFLLDIIMPGMDGMSLAHALRERAGRCAIIFLTSSPEFAVEAFAVKAADYLVKPVQKARLFEAMDSAIAALGDAVEATTVIPAQEYDLTVRLGDIITVEVTGHTLTYRLAGGKTVVSKVLRISFEQATAALAADPRFLCPHRSYLLNMAHVERLTKDAFLMRGGAEVPLSRLRQAESRQKYADFLARSGG
ncbi:LytTR family DNA-binding domain-containing protein [Ruminococcaceae bacterium OttesenSCG-928-D13]|nr:LytTR family DNA-binding domain-containing protein [Ruminococcaceae bacterium OttesenSCG-928-D13]